MKESVSALAWLVLSASDFTDCGLGHRCDDLRLGHLRRFRHRHNSYRITLDRPLPPGEYAPSRARTCFRMVLFWGRPLSRDKEFRFKLRSNMLEETPP